MRESEYQALLPKLQANIPLDVIAKQTSHPLSTLYSIFSGYHQTRIRRLVPIMRRQDKIEELIACYLSGQHITDLAFTMSYSPCLLARSIMEIHYGLHKTDISAALRDPSIITDERLKHELEECCTHDIHYSPTADRIRLSVGLSFEHALCLRLHALNIHYEDENELKRQGHAKTPDIRLCVPIAVRGHIVNWIDSKAMFGDRLTHQHHQTQLQSYCNRYGSGLVIYWFSFIDEIQSTSSSVLYMDHFPDQHEITTMVNYEQHDKQQTPTYQQHPLAIKLPQVIQSVLDRAQQCHNESTVTATATATTTATATFTATTTITSTKATENPSTSSDMT